MGVASARGGKSPAPRGAEGAAAKVARAEGSAPERLQQEAGNLAVQSLFTQGMLHPKLAVGAPDDPLEKEADKAAETVVAGGKAPCACGGTCADCRGGSAGVIRRQPEGGAGAPSGPAAARDAGLAGAGRPLSHAERGFFEPRFGSDLSSVRLHTGSDAGRAAREMKARAFAYGSNIAFSSGAYVPGTKSGNLLLAHELAHVLQSGGGAGPVRRFLDPRALWGGIASLLPVSPASMTPEQRLARISEILENWWVGPDNESELEALWGAFGDDLPRVAGENLEIWNQSWQRGARLADLPPVRSFLDRFDAEARTTLAGVLTDSETRINAERIRYGIEEVRTTTTERRRVPTGDRGPGGMPIMSTEDVEVTHVSHRMPEAPAATGLQTAAQELLAKRADVDRRKADLRGRQRAYERIVVYPMDMDSPGLSHSDIDITNPEAHAALGEEMEQVEAEYTELRARLESSYPILAAYAEDGLEGIRTISSGPSPETAGALHTVIAERLSNIAAVREEMGEGGRLVVWKLPQILDMTKSRLGYSEESLHAFMVAAQVDQYESDHALQELALGAVALGLGLLAAIPTGGSSLVAAGVAVAAIGAAGVSAYMASEHFQDYLLESAATGTDFDRARAVSQSDPSLFWLALDIVGAMVDLGGAVAAIRASLLAARTTFREMSVLVRAASRAEGGTDEAMDAIRRVAERSGLPPSVVERILRRARGLREGGDEIAEAVARVEHAELEAGRRIATETAYLAELTAEEAGHAWRITASGALTKCSRPCIFFRGMFAETLARNPELETQLAGLEGRARAAAAAGDRAEGTRILEEMRALEGRVRDVAPPTVPRAEPGMGGRLRAVTDADDLEILRMQRPDPARLPALITDVEDLAQRQLLEQDWAEYCAYYMERLTAIEHELAATGARLDSPLDWEAYLRFVGSRSPFARGRGFQAGVTGSMDEIADAFLTESDIALSRTSRPTSAAGEIVRPDQFMVDQDQLRLLAEGRITSEALGVTAASNKSRDFSRLWESVEAIGDIEAIGRGPIGQIVRQDVVELFTKYSGDLFVRREGPLLGRQVNIRELILIYDINGVPPGLRDIIRSMAGRMAAEHGTGFSFTITFQ